MTSLASQLKSLALPHTQALLGDERKRVSLLFDPSEAANLDKDAVFAIGIGGLEELIEIDTIFMEYEKSLFNESATGLQRLTQSTEINEKLDDTVRVFLIHLSPYFLLRPAQKALEWLIYRYQVHFYNVDDLLMCTMPYHDSNIFARVLQILNLSNPKSKWNWLEQVQKHGTHLPCQTIATHAYKDEGFLNFVCAIPEQFIQVHGHEKAGNNSPVHAAVSFYTKILLNSIQQADPVKESFLAQITTFLLKGLRSRNDEFKCSSYMILSTICSKVTLDESFLNSVLPLLTKRMTIRNGFEALSCLVLVFKTQESVSVLPKRAFKHMCRLPGVVQHLTQLHEWGVLEAFWSHLLDRLVPAAIKDCRLSITSSSDGGGGDGGELTPGKPEYWSLLESLLSDCTLHDIHAAQIIRLMCDGYIENKQDCHTEQAQSLLADRIKAMLRLMEQKYSAIVDKEIKHQMSEGSADDKLIQEFALMTLSSFKYQAVDSDTSLILSLNHSESAMRVHGVKHLAKMLDTENENSIDASFVSESLYARLLDDSDAVCDEVLTINKDYLLKYLSAQQIIKIIQLRMKGGLSVEYCRLLSAHPDVTAASDDVMRLVLISIRRNNHKTVSALNETVEPKPIPGLKTKDDKDWQQSSIKKLAERYSKAETIHQLKVLCTGASPLVSHIVCQILIQICQEPDLPTEVKMDTLNQLLTLCQEISQQDGSVHGRKKYLKMTLQGMAAAFKRWSDNWLDTLVTPYIEFVSLLIQQQQTEILAQTVRDWTAGDQYFDTGFVTMLSTQHDVITLNLLQLVTQALDSDGFSKLNLTTDNSKTIGCLISLLTHPLKLIRKSACNLLNSLSSKSTTGYKLKDLVATLISQTRELTDDHLHINEAVMVFLEEGKRSSTLEALLELICDPRTPVIMCRNLLITLNSYQNSAVLTGIESLLTRLLSDIGSLTTPVNAELLEACLLRYNENSVKLMSSHKSLWNLFITAMTTEACQRQALKQISKEFFDELEDNILKQTIVSKCVDVYLSTEKADLHTTISKIIRHITLPAEVVLSELSAPIKSVGQDQSMRTKKMRRSQAPVAPSDLSSVEWRRVRLILEWLQNKKKMSGVSSLIPTLFKLISKVLDMEEMTGGDYIKHLLLGCLDNLLNKLSQSDDEQQDTLTSDELNMELVVQCIRTSKNPQTHQQALLLLRTTAKMFPDIVLHHVMSIFTYMGANIMRQDDMYSFQIITKTLDTVVPEIVKASSSTADYTITSIIRVFVDAYPHIPEHRRLPLFTKLLQTVGDEKYLYACTCLCVEGLVTKNPIPDTSNEYEWKSESNQLVFLLSLYANFSVSCQLEACTRMLDFLCMLPVDTQTQTQPARSKKRGKKTGNAKSSISDGLFDTTLYTDKQLRHFKYQLAGYVVSLVAGSVFVEQVVNEEDDLAKSFNQLIEAGLKYISTVAKESEKHSLLPTAKFWRALLHKSYEILDKVNALLPGAVFINVISSLLSHELPLIRRKAMDLLNNRLPQTVFNEKEVASLIELIGLIKSVALDPNNSQEETEDTTNRQTALYSLKIMTRLLATTEAKPFIDLLPEACEAFDHVHLSTVRANILLLMGELVSQLKINALPHIPSVVPKVIDVLKQDALLDSNHLLWISAVTALQKVVEAIPNFLSQYLLDILTIVTNQSSKVMLASEAYKGYKAQLPARLKSLREILSKEFSPRVFVPVLIKCYPLISETHKKSVECLMSITADHIEYISKDDLSSHHHKLLELFLMALDYRAIHYQEKPAYVEQTEDSIIAATLKMIVKLSEASFRPMYFKLYGWATRETEVNDRLITFYRLSDKIADTLRGLFSLFASHIIKNAAHALDASNSGKEDAARLFRDEPNESAKNRVLCVSIVDCLHKCFLYDTEGFVNRQRFNMLMQPLVDQLENEFDVLNGFNLHHLVPCISQLAIAVGDDSMWKPLIYQICLKTRHSDPWVRKNSLHVIRHLNSKLGEDFMPLLPETIPFLAELMEDDEEDVEALCQDVISDMETVLGEPLQKYF